MQVFAYKMCNFFKKFFQCPTNWAIFLISATPQTINLTIFLNLFAYIRKKQ